MRRRSTVANYRPDWSSGAGVDHSPLARRRRRLSVSRRRRSYLALTVLALASLGWVLVTAAAESRPADSKATATDKTPAADDPDHPEKFAAGLALFKSGVRQTLAAHCVECHGGARVESEFDLTDREGLLKGGRSGRAVVLKEDPKSSRLLRRVLHLDKPGMPFQENRLPDEAISQLVRWIELGAPYDEPLVKDKARAVSWTEKTIPPEARQFWSFQPLRRGEPPLLDGDRWSRTPIDRFIYARLKEQGLAPNSDAPREQLLRRATFGLLGLPPTPEQLDEFLSDDSDGAWGRLLDRLLDNPQYGERWARHWLDVARFAESHGFEHDTDRPTAYHYRDFVIQALNRDLPYDTFVRWQIAGDEFAPQENLALMATGFLAAGVHSTQITANEVEKHRYDELDDMLGTIGQSMLGLSVQCARCHDHKFDPIPQRDYYRLLSTFTTTIRTEVDLHFERDEYERAKQAFDEAHRPLAAALEAFEQQQLPARLAEWEMSSATALAGMPWVIADTAEAKSAGGATLTRQPDGSFLASGTNPQFDTYTFTISTGQRGITGVRIEALADPSLAKGGPGRATNGNFSLTDVKVTAVERSAAVGAPPSGDGAAGPAAPQTVGLRQPRATFEQAGLPVTGAIDDNPQSGWAVDPEFGKDHSCAFALETPVAFDPGALLTVTLSFQGNDKHNLGRPRVSLTTAEGAVDLAAKAVPQSIVETLRRPSSERTPEQAAALLRWYARLDPQWQALHRAVAEHQATAPQPRLVKALVSSEGLPPLRLHTQGGDFLEQTHFLRRGDPGLKEAVATPGFLQALMPADDPTAWVESPPDGWRTSYRRRSLAHWLTDVDHGAGALLARVIVNRLWQHHFGRGIVATPSDFGVRGAPPTHPELLDWLAGELIRQGWRLKPIHKLILESSVYRQSSQYDDARSAIDRENDLLWRRAPQRLEAEVIRDSVLAVSGRLDPAMFGPGTLDETTRRRSIYFTVKRSRLLAMMQVFDAPDALSSIGERPTTTVAPQALLLMNNPQSRAAAESFAGRIAGTADDSAAVRQAYRIALSRDPGADELAEGVEFIAAQTATYAGMPADVARRHALTDFCQVVLCLNEFVYVP